MSNAPKRTSKRPPTAPVAGDSASAVDTTAAPLPWWRRFLTRPNYLGLVVAALAFQWALTPSLLPRPWLFEGVIAGIGAAIGYGLGCSLSWLVRTTPLRERGPVFKHRAWIAPRGAGPLYALVSLLLGVGWQNEVRTLVGMPDEGLATALEVAVVAVPVAIGCWLLGRALRRFNRWIARHLGRFIPRPVAWTGAVVIIGLLIYVAVTASFPWLRRRHEQHLRRRQREHEGRHQTADLRAALGLEAVVLRLGHPGHGGAQLRRARSELHPDLEPHRQARAAADPRLRRPRRRRHRRRSREDRRAGAAAHRRVQPQDPRRRGHDRHRLARAAVDGHDRVRVERRQRDRGIQYSYLPSWISTLVDADKAKEAGKALFDAVYAEWVKLPETSAPSSSPTA